MAISQSVAEIRRFFSF